ncbi:MAG: rhodanese-like domain-containing protein [Acidobacteria bacterium]|nr:rhodanese-like domain-containing protein [Acidobacteriota bacterium]
MKSSSKLGVFILAVAAAALVSGCTSNTLPAYRAYANDADVPRINVEEAKKDVDAGIAVIVDSRPAFAFKHERIADSLNVVWGSSEDAYGVLPKDKKIIVYCSCAAEHTSAALAYQMNQKGIANTYALVGGTAAWKNAGYPMASGD